MSFFRYPGGKSKMKDIFLAYLNLYSKESGLEYREPFFGGGSIGLKFISNNSQWEKIWINDKDIGVSSLWTSVIRYPEELKCKVQDFLPSIEMFDAYKFDLLDSQGSTIFPDEKEKIVKIGFEKLAIHQISYSGLGTKSGGPLGGREQRSKYKIDCRWSPDYICKKIDELHKLFLNFKICEGRCTNYDYRKVICSYGDSLLYLDPPYYIKGNSLYQCGFSLCDHKELAEILKSIENPWILSYDDCPEIRSLYEWAKIEPINVNYSITATRDKESGKALSRTKSELLIFSPRYKEILPDVSESLLS